jgi:hypothetical protein
MSVEVAMEYLMGLTTSPHVEQLQVGQLASQPRHSQLFRHCQDAQQQQQQQQQQWLQLQ